MTRQQSCDLYLAIYTRYLIGLAVAAWLAFEGYYLEAALFAVGWIALRIVYARWLFPHLAPFLGYRLAATRQDPTLITPANTPVNVTLYTAAGCPFCPLVERQLKHLQEQMGFALNVEDVTLRPHLLTSKGYRAVPLIEIGDRHLVGNVSPPALAAFIQDRAAA